MKMNMGVNVTWRLSVLKVNVTWRLSVLKEMCLTWLTCLFLSFNYAPYGNG